MLNYTGTVVDTDIVHPQLLDFYLCSHYGPLGTSIPAHYHVVHDDADHTLQEIEELSYFLCYTYARCPKCVHTHLFDYFSENLLFL